MLQVAVPPYLRSYKMVSSCSSQRMLLVALLWPTSAVQYWFVFTVTLGWEPHFEQSHWPVVPPSPRVPHLEVERLSWLPFDSALLVKLITSGAEAVLMTLML